MTYKKNILVAPLNWGLGHASRCVPIINKLLKEGFNPIIASDGNALLFLQKEFPNLVSIELPSYDLQYPSNGKFMFWKLLSQVPKIKTAVKKEKRILDQIISEYNIKGIISDNRFGIYSDTVPAAYITHQLNIIAGLFSSIINRVHFSIIRQFKACWVPDFSNRDLSLAGELSQANLKVKYIGPMSRFKPFKQSLYKWDVLVLVSGLEPLRTTFETEMIKRFKHSNNKVLVVRGVPSSKDHNRVIKKDNLFVVDCLFGSELESIIQESELVIARSGYSTIMDLFAMGKKVFFIPTDGQTEQEYLAKHLEAKNIAPYSKLEDFQVSDLNKIQQYKGFTSEQELKLSKDLFDVFKSE